MNQIKKIGVAGAGAMGLGIAQVFAQSGYEVVLFDVNENQLTKAKTEISKNLDFAVSKDKINAAEKDATLSRITYINQLNTKKRFWLLIPLQYR
jgi:3-hydroxybutyryl-CoA dehydrogenase